MSTLSVLALVPLLDFACLLHPLVVVGRPPCDYAPYMQKHVCYSEMLSCTLQVICWLVLILFRLPFIMVNIPCPLLLWSICFCYRMLSLFLPYPCCSTGNHTVNIPPPYMHRISTLHLGFFILRPHVNHWYPFPFQYPYTSTRSFVAFSRLYLPLLCSFALSSSTDPTSIHSHAHTVIIQTSDRHSSAFLTLYLPGLC